METSNVVAVQEKTTIRKRINQSAFAVGSLVLAAPAFAIDSTLVTEPIKAAEATVDAAGGAMLTLAVGVMVIGVIIGMVFRKGK